MAIRATSWEEPPLLYILVNLTCISYKTDPQNWAPSRGEFPRFEIENFWNALAVLAVLSVAVLLFN